MNNSPHTSPQLARRPLRRQSREKGIHRQFQSPKSSCNKSDNILEESDEDDLLTEDEDELQSGYNEKEYDKHLQLKLEYEQHLRISSIVSKKRKGEIKQLPDDKCKDTFFDNVSLKHLVCIALALVLICIISVYLSQRYGEPSTDTTETVFATELKGVESRFVHQPQRTWNVIKATTKYVINSPPSLQPAVILILAPHGSDAVAQCLAHFLAQAVSRSLSHTKYPVIKAAALSKSDAGRVKKRIDSIFHEQFDNDRRGVIVLEDVDRLPGEGAMMLHSLCDDTNAKYKQTVILLTATARHKDCGMSMLPDKMAIQHLNDVWQDSLTEDYRGGLVSRLTGGVVVMLPDSTPDECLDRKCPLGSEEFCELQIMT